MSLTLSTEEQEYFFNLIDEHFPDTIFNSTKDTCEHIWEYSSFNRVCINCALVKDTDLNEEEPTGHLNEKYHTTTVMGNVSNKYRHINRLQVWSNYDHKEKTLMDTTGIIEGICGRFKLQLKIKHQASLYYKIIYIDNQLSLRGNIKKSSLIFCIKKACEYYNTDFKLSDAFKYINQEKLKCEKCLTMENYNSFLEKVKHIYPEDYTYTNKTIDKNYEICLNNNIQINKADIITKYLSIDKTTKINNNTLVLGIIYDMLKQTLTLSQFTKMFKTTKITIKKYYKLN